MHISGLKFNPAHHDLSVSTKPSHGRNSAEVGEHWGMGGPCWNLDELSNPPQSQLTTQASAPTPQLLLCYNSPVVNSSKKQRICLIVWHNQPKFCGIVSALAWLNWIVLGFIFFPCFFYFFSSLFCESIILIAVFLIFRFQCHRQCWAAVCVNSCRSKVQLV